ncbi:MAG: hypothetical protein H7239_03435 [Flavobacterium sp.]|nr:hypothetical protein [Flavobacterium sp.]
MKKSILKKLVLISCFLAILLTSCEKEPLEEENANYISNIKKTKVNFADFKENKKAFDVFKNLNLTDTKPNIKNLNVQNATSYNFEINFNDGTHLSYHNLESYTFPIRRVIDNGLLENIVISKHTDGKYYAKLLKYNLTSQENIDLANDELKNILNPIVTEVLGEYSFGNQTQSNCGFETHTIITPCANGHTSVSQCQLTGAAAPRIRTVTVAIDCTGGEGGGGGGVYNTPNFPNETTPIEYYENGLSEPVLSTENPVTLRTPCIKVKSITNTTPNLKNKIAELKTPQVLTLNYEKGFNLVDNAQNETELTQNDGNPNTTFITVIVPEDGSMPAFLHSHFNRPDMLPTFTFEDLMTFNAIYQWRKYRGKSLDNLTLMVVTRAGVFAMMIENNPIFDTTGSNLWTDQTVNLRDNFNKGILEKTNLTDDDVIIEVTKGLANFGIGLYQANSDLSSWNKLTVNANNEKITTPCN